MAIESKVLNRLITLPFYQQNSGLFFVIFLLLFGVVHGSEAIYYHLTLMYAMLGSPIFLGVVAIVWLFYAFKCIQFVNKSMTASENQFLYVLSCSSPRKQFILFFLLQLLLYAPVGLYSIIVVGVGVFSHQWVSSSFVIIYNLSLCILSTFFYIHKLKRPNSGYAFFLSNIIRIGVAKPFPLFFISHLMNEMKIIYVVTKLISALIIIAFLNGFFIDTYDSRVIFLGFLGGITAHSVLVFEFRKFEERFLGFYRNLPLSTIRRFFTFMLIYVIVLIPEWIIFSSAVGTKLKIEDALWLPGFGIGILLLIHCLLYLSFIDADKYLFWVFGIFILLLSGKSPCRICPFGSR